MKIIGINPTKTSEIFYGDDPINPTKIFSGNADVYKNGYYKDLHYVELKNNLYFEMDLLFCLTNLGERTCEFKDVDLNVTENKDVMYHMRLTDTNGLGSFLRMINEGLITLTDKNMYRGIFTMHKLHGMHVIRPIDPSSLKL